MEEAQRVVCQSCEYKHYHHEDPDRHAGWCCMFADMMLCCGKYSMEVR